jgi:hypothetical protein
MSVLSEEVQQLYRPLKKLGLLAADKLKEQQTRFRSRKERAAK